jgi:hypothetical protein
MEPFNAFETHPMKDEIRTHLDDPRQLETLYRANKGLFTQAFTALYPDIKGNPAAEFWHERLTHESDPIRWGTGGELIVVLLASLAAGLIAKLPDFLSINEEFFYPRNVGFIVIPALMAYFAWKTNLSLVRIAFIAGATLVGLLFINAFPDVPQSDTLVLSCLHVVFFLWALLGVSFVGGQVNNEEKRLRFLKYNGDLVVMTTLILISGAILTAITINLFLLIGFSIGDFYFKNIGIYGLAAAPIVGTYLTQTNPQLVGKVSPVLAKLFSPLVLVMLFAYLIAILYSGKDPYNDREFLLLFNALLIGVLAILFFSVVETAKTSKNGVETGVLFLLAVLTIVVNGVALSAIVFRIIEGGITPNRAAVLGSNVLILIHLLLVTAQLFRVLFRSADLGGVGNAIVRYLPVYFVWSCLVTFLFPYLFGFK